MFTGFFFQFPSSCSLLCIFLRFLPIFSASFLHSFFFSFTFLLLKQKRKINPFCYPGIPPLFSFFNLPFVPLLFPSLLFLQTSTCPLQPATTSFTNILFNNSLNTFIFFSLRLFGCLSFLIDPVSFSFIIVVTIIIYLNWTNACLNQNIAVAILMWGKNN